jgi:16S rRNA (uracil1498-N3)-methyltransferase
MQLPYFFEDEITIATQQHTLSNATHKHASQVLRLKENDSLVLCNGKGILATATILSTSKKNTTVGLNSITEEIKPTPALHIAISPLKNPSRLEWFVEKAIEIGVTEISLIQCQRTEKEFTKLERLQNVAVAAMLQSRQAWLTTINAPILFDNFLQQLPTNGENFIAHCHEEFPKNSIISLPTTLKNKVVLIGPEGDFIQHEVELANKQNFVGISLGNTRLRTETAGIVAATLFKNK